MVTPITFSATWATPVRGRPPDVTASSLCRYAHARRCMAVALTCPRRRSASMLTVGLCSLPSVDQPGSRTQQDTGVDRVARVRWTGRGLLRDVRHWWSPLHLPDRQGRGPHGSQGPPAARPRHARSLPRWWRLRQGASGEGPHTAALPQEVSSERAYETRPEPGQGRSGSCG